MKRWWRAALLVPTAWPQILPLEKLLMPSGDIDSAPRNSASVAISSPAAFSSTSRQLMSSIIIKYICNTVCTQMTLGPRCSDLQLLLCSSSFHCEKLTEALRVNFN